MTDTRPQKITLNTPKGIAKWPKLTEPDYGTADYPKPEGEYSVKLIFDADSPALIAFQKKLQPYLDEAEALGQAAFDALKKPQRDKLGAMKLNPLFTPIYDAEENDTGQVEFKLTMKAGGVVKKGPREGKKWTRKPDLFDALGRKITSKVEIWGGSDLICGFSIVKGGYFIAGTGVAGLKCSLEAVQIVTLRQGGERSAESYGFGKHEDGFSADSIQPEAEGEDDEFAGGPDEHLPSGNNDDEPQGASGF
jgi:hypothetical protein